MIVRETVSHVPQASVLHPPELLPPHELAPHGLQLVAQGAEQQWLTRCRQWPASAVAVKATTAAKDKNKRMLCNSSQRKCLTNLHNRNARHPVRQLNPKSIGCVLQTHPLQKIHRNYAKRHELPILLTGNSKNCQNRTTFPSMATSTTDLKIRQETLILVNQVRKSLEFGISMRAYFGALGHTTNAR